MATYKARTDDSDKDYPIDDVYFAEKYKWVRYTVPEAYELLAETQHPTQYNNPTARIMACVELSMAADKKVKRELHHCNFVKHLGSKTRKMFVISSVSKCF